MSKQAPKKIKITLDIEKMKIGDLKLLGRAGRGELGEDELIEFLNRIVEEDVEEMPITALPQITRALQDAVTEAANPEDAEGN